MNQPSMFENMSGKRSTGAALLFAIVMIMGMLWIYNDPPGTKFDKPEPVHSTQNKEPKTIQTSYGWYFFRMVAVTGFLIVVFIVGAKYAKRKMTQSGQYFDIQVLGKQYINAKQYLMMVRVEEKKMLLGITDHSINLLKELDEEMSNHKSSENREKIDEGYKKIIETKPGG